LFYEEIEKCVSKAYAYIVCFYDSLLYILFSVPRIKLIGLIMSVYFIVMPGQSVIFIVRSAILILPNADGLVINK